MHLRKTEAIYFSVEDWTVDSALNPHANFDFWRMELRARGAVSVDQHPGQSNKIAWTGKSVTRIGVLQTVRRNSEAYCAEKSERGGLRFANPPYKPNDVRLVLHSPLQQDRQWVLQLS
jgi:hypothetical protein